MGCTSSTAISTVEVVPAHGDSSPTKRRLKRQASSTPSVCSRRLSMIEEELLQQQEQRVIFYDIVLIGDRVRPMAEKLFSLPRMHRAYYSSSGSCSTHDPAVSLESLGDNDDCSEPLTATSSRSLPASPLLSNGATSSVNLMTAKRSKEAAPPKHYTVYTEEEEATIHLRIWPVSSGDSLPQFAPGEQDSVLYAVLFPSWTFDCLESLKLRGRVEEVKQGIKEQRNRNVVGIPVYYDEVLECGFSEEDFREQCMAWADGLDIPDITDGSGVSLDNTIFLFRALMRQAKTDMATKGLFANAVDGTKPGKRTGLVDGDELRAQEDFDDSVDDDEEHSQLVTV